MAMSIRSHSSIGVNEMISSSLPCVSDFQISRSPSARASRR